MVDLEDLNTPLHFCRCAVGVVEFERSCWERSCKTGVLWVEVFQSLKRLFWFGLEGIKNDLALWDLCDWVSEGLRDYSVPFLAFRRCG
jgi:hypothetical protein